MSKYEVGQEIAPGVKAIQFTSSGRTQVEFPSYSTAWLDSDQIETLELLGDRIRSLESENAELKQHFPTGWRTGVPDVSGVNPESWVEYVEDDDDENRLLRARSVLHEESEWANTTHRIIPYVAPPAPSPPKQLTVDDLPTFDGRVQWSFLYADLDGDNALNPWKIYAIIEDTEVPISDWYGSKHAAVEAAIEAVNAGKLDQFLEGGK